MLTASGGGGGGGGATVAAPCAPTPARGRSKLTSLPVAGAGRLAIRRLAEAVASYLPAWAAALRQVAPAHLGLMVPLDAAVTRLMAAERAAAVVASDSVWEAADAIGQAVPCLAAWVGAFLREFSAARLEPWVEPAAHEPSVVDGWGELLQEFVNAYPLRGSAARTAATRQLLEDIFNPSPLVAWQEADLQRGRSTLSDLIAHCAAARRQIGRPPLPLQAWLALTHVLAGVDGEMAAELSARAVRWRQLREPLPVAAPPTDAAALERAAATLAGLRQAAPGAAAAALRAYWPAVDLAAALATRGGALADAAAALGGNLALPPDLVRVPRALLGAPRSPLRAPGARDGAWGEACDRWLPMLTREMGESADDRLRALVALSAASARAGSGLAQLLATLLIQRLAGRRLGLQPSGSAGGGEVPPVLSAAGDADVRADGSSTAPQARSAAAADHAAVASDAAIEDMLPKRLRGPSIAFLSEPSPEPNAESLPADATGQASVAGDGRALSAVAAAACWEAIAARAETPYHWVALFALLGADESAAAPSGAAVPAAGPAPCPASSWCAQGLARLAPDLATRDAALACGRALMDLPLPELGYVLGSLLDDPPDAELAALQVRLALLRGAPPPAATAAVLARARLELVQLRPAAAAANAEHIAAVWRAHRAGALDAATMRGWGARTALLVPDAFAAIVAACRGPDAAATLVRQVAALPAAVDASALVAAALDAMHRAGEGGRLPLDVADARLRARRQQSAAATYVEVAGVRLPRRTDPGRDEAAIPPARCAELVDVPSTRRHLHACAMAWKLGTPARLEGATGTGKTSLLLALAHHTGTPTRRVNLSYLTDVSDLVGRKVAGEARYAAADLAARSDAELLDIAAEIGVRRPSLTRAQRIEAILVQQIEVRWVDGPVTLAMRRGELVILDEISLAQPRVIEALGGLLDDRACLVLSANHDELVVPHPDFRLFATMNPSSYAGSEPLSAAMLSRWQAVQVNAMPTAERLACMQARYGDQVPAPLLRQLVDAHEALAQVAARPQFRRAARAIAYTPRDLDKVAQRFVRHRHCALADGPLMAREAAEVLLGKAADLALQAALADALASYFPECRNDFYADLELVDCPDGVQIGDVLIRDLQTGHPRVPRGPFVMTPGRCALLYRLAKALSMGEHVALEGPPASGKTSVVMLYAQLRGQPLYAKQFSASTDAYDLVGGMTEAGWEDGLLTHAARPDGVPGIFSAEEFNLADPGKLGRLNQLWDDDRRICLYEQGGGAQFDAHPQFRFVATLNPPSVENVGRQELPASICNRFTQVQCTAPSPEDLRLIAAAQIKSAYPELAAASAAALAACLVRTHHSLVERHEATHTRGSGARMARRWGARDLQRATLQALHCAPEAGLYDAVKAAFEMHYVGPMGLDPAPAAAALATELGEMGALAPC